MLNSDFSYDKYSEYEKIIYEELGSLKYYEQSLELSEHDINCLLSEYQKILKILIPCFPLQKEKWNNICIQISQALKEIKRVKIIYSLDNELDKRYLPNAWYITPLGDLYNTGYGHNETNLSYAFDRVKWSFDNNYNITDTSYYINKKLKIKNEECVNKFDYDEYIGRLKMKTIYDNELVTYDPKVIKFICGVLSAEASFYDFFEKLQKYTLNPNDELNKIIEICNNDFSEILMRCCGFAKVETCIDKTISTCNLLSIGDYYEYLKRGWNIRVDSPIVINKEKGNVELLDISSPLVEVYINEKIKMYEKNKEDTFGNIHKKIMKMR